MKLTNKLIAALVLGVLCSACAMTDDSGKGAKGNGSSSKKGPPAEAFTACKSLSVGASCSVTTQRGTIEGSCKAPPRGQSSVLACVPAGGMKKGERPSK